jgi:hypothetical protein
VALAPATGQAQTGPPPSHSDDDFYYEHHAQHGPSDGHLPASKSNVELVGKRKLTNQVGDISVVSALQTQDGRWFAYVGDWGAECQTGGVHVVDITDPANPVKVGFLNAGGTGYQTEGIQALRIDTTAHTGDILVVSNEWCLQKSNPKLNPGGITIYDIDDPTDPVRLVQGFGDFDLHGNRANESHSAIAWDAGNGRAYAAAIDNEGLDVQERRSPRCSSIVVWSSPATWRTFAGTGLPKGAHPPSSVPNCHLRELLRASAA